MIRETAGTRSQLTGPPATGAAFWYESHAACTPAIPLPPRTKSSRALRRAAVAAASFGSSRNAPVVLARKIASYCARFFSFTSAGS